jgi:mannose-6-phosphate isomerase-like protein (cupin superfamily)
MIVKKIWEENEKEPPREKLLIRKDQTETIALGYVSVNHGESTDPGFHHDEEEIYVILKGKAILTIGEEECEVGPGSVAYVPRNQPHRMTCASGEKLEYLYFANWPDKTS